MILDAYVDRFVGLLANLLKEEVVMLLGVNDDLRRFMERLEIIKDLLEDAERKRIHNKAVNNWLNKLKDVMYDADDMLDLCRIEGEKRRSYMEQQSSATSLTTVCCLPPLFSCFTQVPYRHEIGIKIKELNARLEEISKLRSEFQLQLAAAGGDDGGTGRVTRGSSPVYDYEVVGRSIEENTNTLVGLLIKLDEKNCPLFAITGMGGIGKTTLAQKVMDDELIKKNFETLIWVCVSKDLKEVNLLKEVIRSAGGNHGDAQTRAELEPILRTVLRSRKIFLVLDDVWVGEVWDDLLRNPLKSVMSGSRVLVTTRNEGVARQMGAIYLQHIEQMPLEDGWALLCKKAGVIGEREIEDLKEIGMQIVEKCDGLPLAIKTIGGVLKKKEARRRAWEKVLQNEAWSITGLPEEIMGALYLSYEDLPSHLKQCFLYCSLYPEDFLIHRFDIVELWMAEGFVQGGVAWEMEDLGNDYYKELVERSLLQPDPSVFEQGGCRMHDVLRSFGHYLMQGESHFGDLQELQPSSLKLRRLSIASGGVVEIPDALKEHKYLRTLLLSHNPLTGILPSDLFEKLRHLRVLNLSYSCIQYLPDSVCHLIHLRSLDASYSMLKELPEAIINLGNLRSLDVSCCPDFHNIPNSIMQLRSLTNFQLFGIPVSHIPMGIGGLKHLNKLIGFMAGDDNCSTLEDLKALSSLSSLSIVKLEGASVRSEKRGETLRNMSRLSKLSLDCTSRRDQFGHERRQPCEKEEEEEINRIQKVFEELSPPSCLEILEISGFFGLDFPRWLTSPTISLSSLVFLNLIDCINCEQLPPLGLLPLLKSLIIEGASAIVSIGLEFLGGCSSSKAAFPRLDYLYIRRMPNLKEWNLGVTKCCTEPTVVMPLLTILKLQDCPMLRALPVGLREGANPLAELVISGAQSLGFIEDHSFLAKKLFLIENQSLERVANLSTLEILMIRDCPALKQVENLNGLKNLYLDDFPMQCFAEWLAGLQQHTRNTNKPEVYLTNCSLEFIRRCLPGSPDWPKIQQMHNVLLATADRSAYLSYQSTIGHNTNLSEPDASTSTEPDG